MSKQISTHDALPAAPQFGSAEIEIISGIDSLESLELEKFMHEELTIVVSPSTRDDDYEVVFPAVNGSNQPIMRGVPTLVKRKYVEALVNACEHRKHMPEVMNPAQADKNELITRAVASYPFTVIHDPNPAGHAWLTRLFRRAVL